jgi:hypothetical protein
MRYRITDWLDGRPRQPAVSSHFAVVDGDEVEHNTEELASDIARRIMEAKTSRSYLEKYAPVLGWDFVAQRLAAGPQRVRRGDFGEVVACGWLEDYDALVVPVKKLRSQFTPGQTLPITDAVAFRIVNEVIENVHFLEAKLRTKNVMLARVAVSAYHQLASDRETTFREILQYVHEQLHRDGNPLVDAVTNYLLRRVPSTDDSHDIVLIIEKEIWTEDIHTELDAIASASALPNCRVHGLRAKNIASLIDQAFAEAGMALIDEMEEG